MTASEGSAGARWTILAVGLAVGLRAPRLVNRWDEVALAYSAYAAPTSERLWGGQLGDAAATWVGLHPPLHAWMMALLDGVWPAPILWMLMSVVCSVAAVAVVGRQAGPVAALVLATAPLQLQDAAEVNNYPLAIFGMAVLLAVARRSWGWFLIGVFVASWGHVLGLAAAGLLTAWRLWSPAHPGERVPVAAGAILIVAPLLIGIVRLSGEGSTFAQPPLQVQPWLELVLHSVGLEGLFLGLMVVLGVVVRPGSHSVVWAALAGSYGIALVAGAAAPHQRPYLGLFGPAAAVAVAVGCRWTVRRFGVPGRGLMAVVVAACLFRAVSAGWGEWETMRAIRADCAVERGVDHAIASTDEGDVLWLVAPALQADDDKTDHSAVLWRLPPWSAMPRVAVRDPGFAYSDWLWGQPRLMHGRVVHTSTELDPGRFDAVVEQARAGGHGVAVVLYDHGPATGLLERVRRNVRIYDPKEVEFPRDHGLGEDYVWLIRAEEQPGAHP